MSVQQDKQMTRVTTQVSISAFCVALQWFLSYKYYFKPGTEMHKVLAFNCDFLWIGFVWFAGMSIF